MADEQRSDAVLRHMQARARQPRTIAAGAGQNPVTLVVPMQVRVQYDHPGYAHDYYPHSMADQIDASRFMHVGVSSPQRACSSTGAQRQRYASMGATFDQ